MTESLSKLGLFAMAVGRKEGGKEGRKEGRGKIPPSWLGLDYKTNLTNYE